MEETRINVIDMSGEEPKEYTIQMPRLPEWSMAEAIGYEPKTTFWRDFSIADIYGPEAIADTFKRAFREWRGDVTYLAELALVLNHKGCAYYYVSEQRDNDPILYKLAELYFAMYRKVDDWARENLTGEDEEYYFRVTD